MNKEYFTRIIPTYKQQIDGLHYRVGLIKERLLNIDVPKYRTSGIFDQLILQVQQAMDGNDLYTALEADYSDTFLVWE